MIYNLTFSPFFEAKDHGISVVFFLCKMSVLPFCDRAHFALLPNQSSHRRSLAQVVSDVYFGYQANSVMVSAVMVEPKPAKTSNEPFVKSDSENIHI